jgi:hypothetical protein
MVCFFLALSASGCDCLASVFGFLEVCLLVCLVVLFVDFGLFAMDWLFAIRRRHSSNSYFGFLFLAFAVLGFS